MRRNCGDAAAHHSTHNTQDHTHTYQHQQQATHHKAKHAPAGAWRRAATTLCVALVSRRTRFLKSGTITYQLKGSFDV